MQSSEKKSLYRFLFIYVTSTFTLFAIGAVIFYKFQVYQIEQSERRVLKYNSDKMIHTLQQLHKSSKKALIYPNDPLLKTAIYDIDKGYIFGSFKPKDIDWSSEFSIVGSSMRHIRAVSPYYLGVAYLITQQEIDQAPICSIRKIVALSTVAIFLLILILGYFLGNLFIAPMRDSLKKINLFVQDTTHELNTPISTILTNIEMLEILGKCGDSKEMKRIEIASKTLSHIYDDLTYLKLNQEYQRHPEDVDISALLLQRLDYFSTMIEMKRLEIDLSIEPGIIKHIDPSDAIRLYDNLISNAIKYNQIGGTLAVRLSKSSFSIRDSGRGISKKALSHIFDRFHREDDSEGGFGIGLDIVSQVARHYDYSIDIISKEKEGTTVTVSWRAEDIAS